MTLWLRLLTSRSSFAMLVIIAIASVIANTGWRVVMNNFAVDTVGMTGADVGYCRVLGNPRLAFIYCFVSVVHRVRTKSRGIVGCNIRARCCSNGVSAFDLWLLFQHDDHVYWFPLFRGGEQIILNTIVSD